MCSCIPPSSCNHPTEEVLLPVPLHLALTKATADTFGERRALPERFCQIIFVECVTPWRLRCCYSCAVFQHLPTRSRQKRLLPILQVVDNMLVATPFRVLDIFTTYAFCAAYLLFNIVWYYFGPLDERLIYGTLDWKNCPLASAANVLLTFFILLPVSAWIHYGVFRCVWCARRGFRVSTLFS